MAISKKTRFEVFKRDKFTCQYCGKSAPDVILEADHIHPVSKGGDDDLLNLVASCYDCNHGKKDRLLTDDTPIKKRKKQLDELQEKREQFEMLMEWHKSLIDLDTEIINELASFFTALVFPFRADGRIVAERIRGWLKRFDAGEILEAMRLSTDEYLEYSNGGKPIKESVRKAWEYIPKICASKRRNKDKPYMGDLYYTRGILRNRCELTKRQEWECIDLMEGYVLSGLSIEELQTIAKRINSYREFRNVLGLPLEDLCNFMYDKGISEYGQEALQGN